MNKSSRERNIQVEKVELWNLFGAIKSSVERKWIFEWNKLRHCCQGLDTEAKAFPAQQKVNQIESNRRNNNDIERNMSKDDADSLVRICFRNSQYWILIER